MGIFDILLGNSSDNIFQIGDRVMVKYREQEGYIIDKEGSLYTVSINDGEMVDSYEATDLEKI